MCRGRPRGAEGDIHDTISDQWLPSSVTKWKNDILHFMSPKDSNKLENKKDISEILEFFLKVKTRLVPISLMDGFCNIFRVSEQDPSPNSRLMRC